jgi:peptidoglycan/LPS O-acetylase OafA/YrhL
VFKQRIRRISKIQWIILYSIGFASMLLEAKIFQGVFFTFQRLFISMFFAVFIADQLLSNHSFFKVDRLPILAKLGEWTYGIYLFHCIVIFYLEAIFIQNNWISSTYHFLSFIFLVISISIGLSYLSFRWFESPFLRLKNKF